MPAVASRVIEHAGMTIKFFRLPEAEMDRDWESLPA